MFLNCSQTSSCNYLELAPPINPGSVLFLLQSGYPADVVFGLTVESINGVRNQSVSGGQLRPPDPPSPKSSSQYAKHRSRATSVSASIAKKRRSGVAFFFHDENIDPELAAELAEVRKALRLDPDRSEFRVAFGATAANRDEIAILSRSVIRILSELSTFVNVPDEHLANGSAPVIGQQWIDAEPPFQVHCCCEKPQDPFVAVCYEGYWFWIEKSDFRSKRTLAYLLVLLALADTGPKEGCP